MNYVARVDASPQSEQAERPSGCVLLPKKGHTHTPWSGCVSARFRGTNHEFVQSNECERAWDRLAQRRPDVAIEGWHHEYTRGRRLAPLLGEVLAFLRDCVANGETIVVLGRDGELVHQLCRRAGVRTRYALASRALTTKASTPVSDAPGFWARLYGACDALGLRRQVR